MAQMDVSRIRLSGLDKIPVGSQAMTLMPTKYDGVAKPMYLAMDTLGKTYFLAWCGFASVGAKIFLVHDPKTAVSTLMNNQDLRWTVLGGVSGECNLVALTSDPAAFS